MLSISKIKSDAQAEKYYTTKDNYYSGSPGQWFGKGAEQEGSCGEVTERISKP